jgi:hypothetical protein
MGGPVWLDVTLGLHILSMDRPDPADPLSVEIFSEIYSHELLHVADEVDVLTNWLPGRLRGESWIDRYLVQRQTFTYGRASRPIASVDEDFWRYIARQTTSAVRDSLWAPETSRRGAARDTPSEYRKVQERVDVLRARQINS